MGLENVEAAFQQVFRDPRLFGDRVYIIGKNAINKEIKRNIINFYLEYQGEVPLLAFSYEDNMKEGFVITNYRVAWFYDEGDGTKSVELEDIKCAKAGRSVLAKVMRIVDVYGTEHSKMYLTFMNNPDTFVEHFNAFINLLHDQEDDEEDLLDWSSGGSNRSERSSSQSRQSSSAGSTIKDFINLLKKNYSFSSHIYYYGDGEKSAKKFNGAISHYAQLDRDELPLVCYDSTISGDASDGVLISTGGIYIHNYTEETKFFPYSIINNVELKSGFFSKGLYVNDKKIETSGMSDEYIAAFCNIIDACCKVFK